MNLEKFFQTGPIEQFAFITMTFGDKPSPETASQRFHSFWTHVLSEYFECYIRILEGHKDGSPHYHIAARTKGGVDIRSGFNFEYFEEYCRINARKDVGEPIKRKLRLAARKEFGDLGRSDELIAMHARVRATKKNYGVGRTEIVPVKTTSEGVSKYMGKYLTKASVINGDGRKNRIVTYSQGFEKAATARFNWNSPHAKLWRMKLEKFASEQGCASMEDLKVKFGPRWAWKLRSQILNQEGEYEVREYSTKSGKVETVLVEYNPGWSEEALKEKLKMRPGAPPAAKWAKRADDEFGEKRGVSG